MDLKPLASGSLIAAAAFFGFFLTIIGLAGMFGIWAAFVLLPALWHYCPAVLLAAAAAGVMAVGLWSWLTFSYALWLAIAGVAFGGLVYGIGLVVLRVEDNGPGVPEADRST